MISNPEAIEKLNSFNMWQSFLNNTYINMNGSKLKAFCIMHTILRGNASPPMDQTEFPIISSIHQDNKGVSTKSTVASGASYSSDIKDLIIQSPHPLISFGFYLPLKGNPCLTKFSTTTLNTCLRANAYEYLTRLMTVHDDYQLIGLPKIVKWYR